MNWLNWRKYTKYLNHYKLLCLLYMGIHIGYGTYLQAMNQSVDIMSGFILGFFFVASMTLLIFPTLDINSLFDDDKCIRK